MKLAGNPIPEIITAIKALHPSHRDNLRYHLAADTRICGAQGWYIDTKGAACLAVLAATRDVPSQAIPDSASLAEALGPGPLGKGITAAFLAMARAVGMAEWHRAETAASEADLRASITLAIE